jgi:two-component system nitrate/nitrite response regulator NarL
MSWGDLLLQSPVRGDPQETVQPARATVRVLVASDVRLLCDGLSMAFASDPAVAVEATVFDAESLVDGSRASLPGVVILDVSMPRALDAARVVASELPGTRIVAVAVDESVNDVVACAEAGIAGYVPQDATFDDLRETLLSVADGETPCSPRIAAGLFRRLATLSAERQLRPALPSRLTAREYEVLRLIQRGLSNKEIAARLHIALPTVKNHVHRILDKLDVDRRGAAADWLRQ